jgi:hypothetical protein
VSTLTWGQIPSIDEINHQVEIGKEVSSRNLFELTQLREEKTLIRQLGSILEDLERSVVEDWDSLPEKTRLGLEKAARSYFARSSESSKRKKISFKRVVLRLLIRAYVYGSFFKALFDDKLEILLADFSFFIKAQSNLMHSVLDVVEKKDEPEMPVFLQFLEKDFKDGNTENCVPYTREMSERYHSLLEGVEAD